MLFIFLKYFVLKLELKFHRYGGFDKAFDISFTR